LIDIDSELGFPIEDDLPIYEVAGLYLSTGTVKAVMPAKIVRAFGFEKKNHSISAVWHYTTSEKFSINKIKELQNKKVKYCLFIPVKRKYKKT